MLKKILSIFMVIFLFVNIGCSNKDVIKHHYIYKGENELWYAEYKVEGTEKFHKENRKVELKSNSRKILIVTYKKDISRLYLVKHLQIAYKSSAGGGELNLDFSHNPPNTKVYMLKSSSEGAAIEAKNETIKVNISIDGRKQTIELKKYEELNI